MGAPKKLKTGDYVPKATKREVLDFIHYFCISSGKYPTVDDFSDKLKRPRKVMADFLSRYAHYGIVEAFKVQGEKTRYGPGINWEKIDNLQWKNFFKAGRCHHCGRNGVIGLVGPKNVRYRCKWCLKEWKVSRDWVNEETWEEIKRQAQITEKQWAHAEQE